MTSIDVNGPSNNGVILVQDILLKIDGLEVSGKSLTDVESKLQVSKNCAYFKFNFSKPDT